MSRSLTSELIPRRARLASGLPTIEILAQQCSASGYRISYDLLGSAADAEDAVQEALAIACKRVNEVKNPDAIASWFHRIVVHHCLSRLRRRTIGKALSILWPGDREPESIVEPGLGADMGLARSQKHRCLMIAVQRLPTKQKAAVVLRYGHDQSIAEIAEMLRIGTGSVKTHLRRALQALRAADLGE